MNDIAEARLVRLENRRREIKAEIAALLDQETDVSERLAEAIAVKDDAALVSLREERQRIRLEREDLESAIDPLDAKIVQARLDVAKATFEDRERVATEAQQRAVERLGKVFRSLDEALDAWEAYAPAYDRWKRAMKQGSRAADDLKRLTNSSTSRAVSVADPLGEAGVQRGWRRDAVAMLGRWSRARARDEAAGGPRIRIVEMEPGDPEPEPTHPEDKLIVVRGEGV